MPSQNLSSGWLGKSKVFRIGVCDPGHEAFRRSAEPQQHLQDPVTLSDWFLPEPGDRRDRDRPKSCPMAVHLIGERRPRQVPLAPPFIERVVERSHVEITLS